MLRGLQMSMSRKFGLAAIFLIAIADVVLDIIRTVYTVNMGAVALDTIWDILEPTIAVIVSSLPTYKALTGIAQKKKNNSCQNLCDRGGPPWQKSHGKIIDALDDAELGIYYMQDSTEIRVHSLLSRSTDGSTDVSMDGSADGSTEGTDTV